jgi:hypothetical protein
MDAEEAIRHEQKDCRKDLLHTRRSWRDPPTKAELAEARKLFDEAQERIDRLTEADQWTEVSPKFWDDTSGTEYEGWRDK